MPASMDPVGLMAMPCCCCIVVSLTSLYPIYHAPAYIIFVLYSTITATCTVFRLLKARNVNTNTWDPGRGRGTPRTLILGSLAPSFNASTQLQLWKKIPRIFYRISPSETPHFEGTDSGNPFPSSRRA